MRSEADSKSTSAERARRQSLARLRLAARKVFGEQVTKRDEGTTSGPATVSSVARWPAPPPERYLGQLTDEFQKALAAERTGLRREDCRFYHTMELPDGEVIRGPWDLRGREREYLGEVDVAGLRVLELGPSSGYLTFWMERHGAEVVCFDAGYDVSIDLLPVLTGDTRQLRFDHFQMVYEYQYAWWFLHRALNSRARMAYGDIYELPHDIGEFDVATFGAILLHLRSPIQALEQAARRTRSTIIVTDVWSGGPETLRENIMRPFPSGEGSRWVVWWELSAGAVIAMLEILGFNCTRVIEHSQLHQHGHKADAPYMDMAMYTVVAQRA